MVCMRLIWLRLNFLGIPLTMTNRSLGSIGILIKEMVAGLTYLLVLSVVSLPVSYGALRVGGTCKYPKRALVSNLAFELRLHHYCLRNRTGERQIHRHYLAIQCSRFRYGCL